MGGVLRPRDGWPEVNREDALYKLDRERELNSAPAVAGHHH
jgi:hypothetical protein